MLYSLLRSMLFKLDPEQAHDFTLRQLSLIYHSPLKFILKQNVVSKPVNCMGLAFNNRLGLAAGLDKDGDCIDALGLLGFGFIEVGTVTPVAQQGNPKPRLFRLPQVEGLINRMGFNNRGVDYLVNNLIQTKYNGIIGVNIGKNRDTSIENSKDDYLTCLDKIYPHADYIAINISSPNTKDLRSLQYGDVLDDLLITIKNKQSALFNKYNKYVPLAVKIAPDLSEAELIQIADSLVRHHIDGVIATNTTLNRDLVKDIPFSQETGGLSGPALQWHSNNIIELLAKELKEKVDIIGGGGINSLLSAREKIIKGADLIQIYTGFIYHGPKLIKKIIDNI